MTEPLHLTFDVACGAPHAFEVWTADIARWWPADHSMSGGPERVVLTKGPTPSDGTLTSWNFQMSGVRTNERWWA